MSKANLVFYSKPREVEGSFMGCLQGQRIKGVGQGRPKETKGGDNFTKHYIDLLWARYFSKHFTDKICLIC